MRQVLEVSTYAFREGGLAGSGNMPEPGFIVYKYNKSVPRYIILKEDGAVIYTKVAERATRFRDVPAQELVLKMMKKETRMYYYRLLFPTR